MVISRFPSEDILLVLLDLVLTNGEKVELPKGMTRLRNAVGPFLFVL